jgi:hypothetical protein
VSIVAVAVMGAAASIVVSIEARFVEFAAPAIASVVCKRRVRAQNQ